MRLYIDSDEYYPFRFLLEKKPTVNDTSVEVPDDKKEWVDRVMKEFAEVQAYLASFDEEDDE